VLATAIASYLTLGYSLIDAVVRAKALVSQGIKHAILDEPKVHRFHFTKEASGSNFDLDHLPQLQLNQEEHYPKFTPCDTQSLGIYPVIDSIEWLKKLVLIGIKTIQLRIKDKQENEVKADIIEAIRFCRKHNVRLFINDYWQLAIKHKAYGIHLGQEDIATADLTAIANAGCRLGISTHSYAEVARTITIKPSYIALGPIFETSSKVMPWIPQGVDAVAQWVKLLSKEYPLVAIGGISFERAKALKKTGVGSVAMISAITEAPDYKKATLALLELWANEETNQSD
jgi:hydroxymethylpyrimidine kinase/phosphomethylpyrimidine kinase/thiamine-phosphate diphosphorylase